TLLGMGAGQPSRVVSVELALKRAGREAAFTLSSTFKASEILCDMFISLSIWYVKPQILPQQEP
ncbi:unnamed protein product, partial [marine sediment metagenome]